jgi:hypothetical protein
MKPLAKSLVDASSILPDAKRDTVLTTLLLTSEGVDVIVACIEPFRQGTARIDEKLVLALYRVCDRKGKLALARSFVFSDLSPPHFRRIFDEVYRRSDLTWIQRNEVLCSLEGFLLHNPQQIPRYEHLILELLKSPQVDRRIRAASMVGMLNQLEAPSLASFARGLQFRNSSVRLNTLSALWYMIERFDRLDPRLREFVSSPSLRAQVSRMRRSDPDHYVRHNAHSVLLALARLRRQR